VVIESFPAGTMAKRGLSYDVMRVENPGLVMLSSCNQGQTGPHAQHPGYGSQLTCLAGFVHLLGERDRSPMILYGPYIDYIAVGYGAIAVLAALARRQRTGEGCYIDLSQYEAGLQFMAPAILEHRVNGTVPMRDGDHDPVAVPHGVYRCRGADQWVALSVWDDAEWARFVMAVGGPKWAHDARWETAAGRRACEAELDGLIGSWTATRTREDVVVRLRAQGLRAAAVLSISEVVSDPQLLHRGFWRDLPHPILDRAKCIAAPFTLSATPSRQERAGPTLGADNDHVFGNILGLGEDERAALARDGVFD
jgi:crotonobetainyl-CoA:carnitine CoA-transferase CaiB-like acyl-CoA transferase